MVDVTTRRRRPPAGSCCWCCLVSSPQQDQDQCQRRWLPTLARGWLQGGAETRTRPAPAGGTHGGVAALALLSKRRLSTNAREAALDRHCNLEKTIGCSKYHVGLFKRQLSSARCSPGQVRVQVRSCLLSQTRVGTSRPAQSWTLMGPSQQNAQQLSIGNPLRVHQTDRPPVLAYRRDSAADAPAARFTGALPPPSTPASPAARRPARTPTRMPCE